MSILRALLVGGIVGAVFALARLQPPAPDNWAGVAGIVGIVAVWMLVGRWLA